MKKYKIELKWGILFTLAMFGWIYLETILGWHDEKIDKHALLTNLFAIPAIVIYFFALSDKRRNYYEGKMNWLQGFLSGVIIGVVIAILSPLTQYITMKYITPDFFSNAIAYAVASGKMELIEAKQYFTLSNYLVQSEIAALAMGAITAAVIAVFTKKS